MLFTYKLHGQHPYALENSPRGWRQAPAPANGDLNSHQSFQVSAHVGDTYSIRVPSLKFVGLPIPKIWLIFGNGVKCDFDL